MENMNLKKLPYQKEKGQSLVELAVGTLVLIWLLSGIFDVGRAIFMQFALQDAAEEGIIYGIAYPGKCDLIETRVRQSLEENSSITMVPSVTIKINNSACVQDNTGLVYGQKMVIEVGSTFTMTMPLLTGTTVNLRGTANGTILRPAPGT